MISYNSMIKNKTMGEYMAWKKIESDITTLDVNQSIEGIYHGKKQVNEEDHSAQHIIETDEGIKKIWGSTVLDRQLGMINPLTKIKVTYLGMAQSSMDSKRKYHNYEVMYDSMHLNGDDINEP